MVEAEEKWRKVELTPYEVYGVERLGKINVTSILGTDSANLYLRGSAGSNKPSHKLLKVNKVTDG